MGPTLDGADDQWRELRESMPLLFAAVAAHGLLSLLVRKTFARKELQVILTPTAVMLIPKQSPTGMYLVQYKDMSYPWFGGAIRERRMCVIPLVFPTSLGLIRLIYYYKFPILLLFVFV